MRYRVLVLRDALLSAGLPECDFRAGLPVWDVPLDVTQSARADAIVAEVLAAFPDPAITDKQWETWTAAEADRQASADIASIEAGSPTPAAALAIALESGKGGDDAAILARAKQRIADRTAVRRARP